MIFSLAVSLACFAAATVVLLYVFCDGGESKLLVIRRHLPNVLDDR